jgi:magnesium transporter
LAAATWIDLLDPTPEQIEEHKPPGLAPAIAVLLERPSNGEPEPRPRMVAVGRYVVGIFLVPVLIHGEQRVYYQELDLIVSTEVLITVRKTPPNGEPLDVAHVLETRQDSDSTGILAYRIVDEIAEAYLDLIDDIDEEIDELEDHVEEWSAQEVRSRISHVRHDLLNIRRTLSPTRDAIREVVDDRVEVEGEELFDHRVELAFGLVYDKLLRASEGLDYSRDLLAGVRDYAVAKIANDQNEVTKRLTVAATLLLFPTFIVGVYGQNFHDIPELSWRLGYAWSWAVIVVATVLQLVYYRRKGWV